MARRDLSKRDASSLAAAQLDVVMREEFSSATETDTVSVAEALSSERVTTTTSQRDVTRVLFISRNEALLNPARQSLDGYINLADLFDEVHILILRHGIAPKQPALRAGNNVWIYTAAASSWWRTPAAGEQLIEEQLAFGDDFRPDLIVARDPFESAWAALKLSDRYDRPAQLHILEDYRQAKFKKASRHNTWRARLAPLLIPRFASVRTLTSAMNTHVAKRYNPSDLAILPRFQNYLGILEQPKQLDLREKYPAFHFFILYVGLLGHESTCYRALDAARFVLQNPQVGMVVLGNGPAKREFEKRAQILGIADKVIFNNQDKNSVPFLKAADMLVVTDTDEWSEDLVLRGAAAGVPMVMAKTECRSDVFTDGLSAFLCEANDTVCFAERVNDLLSKPHLREQFREQTHEYIRKTFHDDETAYRLAYRESIESALFVEPDTAE